MEKTKKKIFNYLESRKTPASTKEIANSINMSINTTRKHLKEMIEKKWTITQLKEGRSYTYLRQPEYYRLKRYNHIKKLEMYNENNSGTNKPIRIRVEREGKIIRVKCTFENTNKTEAESWLKNFNDKHNIYADDIWISDKSYSHGTVNFIEGLIFKKI